jgi:hypothetical protein
MAGLVTAVLTMGDLAYAVSAMVAAAISTTGRCAVAWLVFIRPGLLWLSAAWLATTWTIIVIHVIVRLAIIRHVIVRLVIVKLVIVTGPNNDDISGRCVRASRERPSS